MHKNNNLEPFRVLGVQMRKQVLRVKNDSTEVPRPPRWCLQPHATELPHCHPWDRLGSFNWLWAQKYEATPENSVVLSQKWRRMSSTKRDHIPVAPPEMGFCSVLGTSFRLAAQQRTIARMSLAPSPALQACPLGLLLERNNQQLHPVLGFLLRRTRLDAWWICHRGIQHAGFHNLLYRVL